MVTEIWKDVPGYEGYYQVSNHGNVKSIERTITDSLGHTYNISEKILKNTIDNVGKGYYRVSLSRKCKILFAHVHRLVAWAFIGHQKKGIEVRHLDGNCKNNHINNLAYGTKSENIADAKEHNTFPRWEKRPGAILNRNIAKAIAASKGTNAEIGRKFGIKAGVIRQVRTGETWEAFTREERKLNPYELSVSYKPRKVKKV